MIIPRKIEKNLHADLARGKSILLLGARQTGKTTLIEQILHPDILYSFASVQTRQRYEKAPELLEQELLEKLPEYNKPPVIFIDEVQKIPQVMDIAQTIIDKKLAQFIFTGSSALKLKHGTQLNLLPGRVVLNFMSPLLFDELTQKPDIKELLLYGTLPPIIQESTPENREKDLYSYVQTYLEEEIRAEAKVRNVGNFSRFLELAAGESDRTINFTKLSQSIGISDSTIANYYQILEDCLIALRIDPISESKTKRRLIKSPKYLFFDLGIRRVCANEGTRLPQETLGHLFEHYIGNELIYQSQLYSTQAKVKYWRSANGAEVDFVLDVAKEYIPIEVKWTDAPKASDAKHLKTFLAEYDNAKKAYVVCRTPHRYSLSDNIVALPWQELNRLFNGTTLSAGVF